MKQARNQETQRTNWTQEDVMIRVDALNEIRKLPKVHA
jgi:hypothetical protein